MTDASERLAQFRLLARRVAFASDTHRQEELLACRQECADLIRGIDPDGVKRDRGDYAYGGFDAFGYVLEALEDQTIPDSVKALLLKRNYGRILNGVLLAPGANQRALANLLKIQESALTLYVRKLVKVGVLEATLPSRTGRAWSQTPWGRKAWTLIASREIAAPVPPKELEEAARTIHLAAKSRLIGKADFYRMLKKAVEAKSNVPIYLSTLMTGDIAKHRSAREFHLGVLKLTHHNTLRRPIVWAFRTSKPNEQLFKEFEKASRSTPRLKVCRINQLDVEVPSPQVLDNIGLTYPVAKSVAEMKDKQTSMEVWNRLVGESYLGRHHAASANQ